MNPATDALVAQFPAVKSVQTVMHNLHVHTTLLGPVYKPLQNKGVNNTM